MFRVFILKKKKKNTFSFKCKCVFEIINRSIVDYKLTVVFLKPNLCH